MSSLAREESGVRIVWRAFELRPEPVPTLDPGGEYLQRVWTSSVYPLAERLGMPMALPPVQPRSRLAHQAARWAQRQGRFEDYHAAVFRAFFERGEDIGDVGVLAALAADLGLPAASLQAALDARELEAEVLGDEAESQRLGIDAVPAFVADRRAALTGVRPIEHLRHLVQHVRESGGERR